MSINRGINIESRESKLEMFIPIRAMVKKERRVTVIWKKGKYLS